MDCEDLQTIHHCLMSGKSTIPNLQPEKSYAQFEHFYIPLLLQNVY